MAQQPDDGNQNGGGRRDGIDRAHQRHGQRRLCRRTPNRICCGPTVQATNDGNEHPRREHHRHRLRGDRRQSGDHPGGQHECCRCDQTGSATADTECLGEPDDSPEAGDEQQCPPDALGDPRWNRQQITAGEERSVREEVAVGLILHLAQRCGAVPLMRGAFEKSERVLRQVVLGIGDGEARDLQKREQECESGDSEEPNPTERLGRDQRST
ncbi:unannotated protein [freshwater metagenome]|uniref:Unannotated protein n=1 Tax=freshwater metagenome TaxID=449393 RepID=A0A6J7EAE5_9ZZZZ